MAYENQPNSEYESIDDDTQHYLQQQPPDYLELLPDNDCDNKGKTGHVGDQIKQGLTGRVAEKSLDNDQYQQITNDHDRHHLQREVHNYGTEDYQQQDHVYHSTHVPTGNEADNRSEEGKQGSKICPPPAWVRWLLTILGLCVLCVIVALLVVFVGSHIIADIRSPHMQQ